MLYKDGTETPIILKNVKVVPGLVKNLFSLSTVMRNDWDVSTKTHEKDKVMKIKKGNKEFVFDQKISRNGNGGYLMAIKIQKENQKRTEIKSTEKINQKRTEIKSTEKINAVEEKGTKIDILHEKLGHPSEEVVKSTAKYMKLQITGKF